MWISHPCNRSDDAAPWRLVPVEHHARDQADEPGPQGGGGQAEPDVHPVARLRPDNSRQRDELAGAVAEVGQVEVGRQPLGVLLRRASELVAAVRRHVGHDAAAAKRHQVERHEEDGGLEAAGPLAAADHGEHVARRRLELWQMGLYRQ